MGVDGARSSLEYHEEDGYRGDEEDALFAMDDEVNEPQSTSQQQQQQTRREEGDGEQLSRSIEQRTALVQHPAPRTGGVPSGTPSSGLGNDRQGSPRPPSQPSQQSEDGSVRRGPAPRPFLSTVLN